MRDEKRQKGPRAGKKNSSIISRHKADPPTSGPHPSSFSFVVGMVTCSSRAEARKLAKAVLTKKLAACVNVLDGVESHYWWQGKLEEARECLLLIKTTKAKADAVTQAIRSAHSYEVPEVIFLPIVQGEGKYLKWIRVSVR
ncbi:MAG: divalent-cation tolerance protein CutA [Verrucomicrobiia bacterium]|jgi:periplasmic divalent cation tolerance protein